MGNIAVYIVLIVALVAMLILPYFTNKKRNQEYMNMLDSIKVGDIVETSSGIIGRVVKFCDKGEITTMILETGSKTEKTYLEIDKVTIYKKLKSSKADKLVTDDANVDAENQEEVETEEVETEQVEAEINSETEAENVEKEETKVSSKPRKPRTSKKK